MLRSRMRILGVLVVGVWLAFGSTSFGAWAADDGFVVDTKFSANLGAGFDYGNMLYGYVYSVAVQADGKILVGGTFVTVNKIPSKNLVRLHPNGKVGIAFSTNLGTGFDGSVRSITVQGDGKILVGGDFNTVNGISSNGLARLNAGGKVDIAFSTNLGTGFFRVRSVVVQGDGKILVGGDFETVNGISSYSLARLNKDGTVDTAFSVSLGTGFNSFVDSVVVQADGKILAGGSFGIVNGIYSWHLARLNADGTVDTEFSANLGTGFTSTFYARVDSVVVQEDGKILAGGDFNMVNKIPSNQLARLNADGTVDTEFSANFNMNKRSESPSITLAVQTDGKILIASWYPPYLSRLNSDGTVDTGFNVSLGTGFNGFVEFGGKVFTVAVQVDGKILTGGYFGYVNGIPSIGLARLYEE